MSGELGRQVAHHANGLVGSGSHRPRRAFIEFGKGQSGSFRFIAVDGWMDCRHRERHGRAYVEFTRDGNDDCDPASGRGRAKLEKDGSLSGHIYFRHGDDSGFKAIPFDEQAKPSPATSAKAKRGMR